MALRAGLAVVTALLLVLLGGGAAAAQKAEADGFVAKAVLASQQERDEAEAGEQARSLDPKDEAVLFQLGVVYFSLQKDDQAQSLLEQVFAAKPRLESLGYYVGFM